MHQPFAAALHECHKQIQQFCMSAVFCAGNLKIFNAQVLDGGTYICNANNGNGPMTADIAILRVIGELIFIVKAKVYR